MLFKLIFLLSYFNIKVFIQQNKIALAWAVTTILQVPAFGLNSISVWDS